MQRISETARGRWHGILPQLGISSKLLRNRHGPCPMCGGKDRFRFDDREGKGTWICNKCGSGDGAELVKRVNGVEYKEAAKMVESVVGNVVKMPERPKTERDASKLNGMWRDSIVPTVSDPVGKYLASRCLVGPYPNTLRALQLDGRWIMVAKVAEARGYSVTIHRTFINYDGSVERKIMPGKLPDNVEIRLADPGPILGIAEGIETALSASSLFHVPVWAAISAPLLKKWRPPTGVKKVTIFGDNDKNFTGQETAYSLARSLESDVEVEVKIPTLPGQDWNDVLKDIWSKS
jgi:putative DNA primase/helicase